MTDQYVRADSFVYRRVAGEHLLVALKRDRIAPMFMLTPTAGFLWELLARETTFDALVAQLVAHFEVSEEVAGADVAEFLQQLEGLGAVLRREGPP